MLVMSGYSDSESVEVHIEFLDEEEEDGLDSDGFDSYTVSGSEFGSIQGSETPHVP